MIQINTTAKKIILKTNGHKCEEDIEIVFEEEEAPSIPTDLTGYTVTVPAGWNAVGGYGNFSINGNFADRGDFIGIWIGSNKAGAATDGRVCFVGPSYPELGSPVNFALDNSNQFLLTITGGADVTNQNLIQWLVNNNATFTKLITFTIDSTTCYAEPNMTWGEWVDSSYNNGVYELNSGMQYIELASDSDYAIGYGDTFVKSTDVIENKDYTHIYQGSGGAN